MALHPQRSRRSVAVAIAAFTNGNTASAQIDMLGADYAEIDVSFVLGNTATIASSDGVTISVLSSDNTNASTFATVAANKTSMKVSQTHWYQVRNETGKRYLKLAVTPGTSGVSNEVATVAAFARLSRLKKGPASTSDMLTTNTTNDTVVLASV